MHYIQRLAAEDAYRRAHQPDATALIAQVEALLAALADDDNDDAPPALPTAVPTPDPTPPPTVTYRIPPPADSVRTGKPHRPLVTGKVIGGAVQVAVANEHDDPLLAEGAEVMRRMLHGERPVSASVLDRDAWRRGEEALMHATQVYMEGTRHVG
jgi:hypothetical protein